MSVEQRIEPLAQAVATDLGLSLYDLEFNGGILRVFLDSPSGGVTVDELAAANRALGAALDDADPIPGRYQLEVSSPGIERRLRRAEHWAAAVGETVALKFAPGTPGDRRLRGTILSSDDSGATIDVTEPAPDPDDSTPRRVDFADVTRATIVFEWSGGKKTTGAQRPDQRLDPKEDLA